MVFRYNAILFIQQRKKILTLCGWTWRYYVKWNKPDTKRWVCDSTYLRYLKLSTSFMKDTMNSTKIIEMKGCQWLVWGGGQYGKLVFSGYKISVLGRWDVLEITSYLPNEIIVIVLLQCEYSLIPLFWTHIWWKW